MRRSAIICLIFVFVILLSSCVNEKQDYISGILHYFNENFLFTVSVNDYKFDISADGNGKICYTYPDTIEGTTVELSERGVYKIQYDGLAFDIDESRVRAVLLFAKAIKSISSQTVTTPYINPLGNDIYEATFGNAEFDITLIYTLSDNSLSGIRIADISGRIYEYAVEVKK